MHLEASLLRAIARLSRQGRRATLPELELRVLGEPDALRAALGRLNVASLLTVHGSEVRLTLAGLAVAVSTAAHRREPRAATAAGERRGKRRAA
ncbi:MAG: hypothetical protein IPF92_12830 [Myxococcales bacterium]|jgi:hypothetical protein|nr:hypothetical protein [Myxococcales bacterium]MBL0197368.1 hypothetical protein [Myxococcales bacterium]HQY64857.1 hypothetical protein [Polyangiaceae bacterium]